mmetsp:Transcript_13270/g.24886  ORF Transcript_13270/g.24886 Transcript_13270/m.24886 type:complete len:119 (+) Transcript_13270:1187-1543(+)
MNLLDEPLPQRPKPDAKPPRKPWIFDRGALTSHAKIVLGLATSGSYIILLAYKNTWIRNLDFTRLQRQYKITKALMVVSAFSLLLNPAEMYLWQQVSDQVRFWQGLRKSKGGDADSKL